MRIGPSPPLIALALFLSGSAPIRADFIIISQPDAAYLAATSLLPITAPDNTTVMSLTDGFQTATIGALGAIATTSPTTFATWSSPPNSETATPRVLWTGFGIAYTEITLSAPSKIFGVELQPNNQAVIADISAYFYDGGTSGTLVGSIDLSVNGNGGARLFAASSTTNSFDTIALAINFFQDDSFGMAQFRYGPPAAVPEPNSLHLLGIAGLIGGAGVWHRRRRLRPTLA